MSLTTNLRFRLYLIRISTEQHPTTTVDIYNHIILSSISFKDPTYNTRNPNQFDIPTHSTLYNS